MDRNKFLSLILALMIIFSLFMPSQAKAAALISRSEDNSWTSFTEMKPMFNVPANKEFSITFKSDVKRFYSNMKLANSGYIKVFTDPECKNQVWARVEETSKNIITVKPPTVYSAYRLRKGIDYRTEKDYTWGGYQRYYLVIARDMNSTTFQELDKPLRMMFTIESPSEIPTVSFQVDRNGLAELSWNPVPGATEYKIYKALGNNSSSVNYFASTKDVKFNDFALKGFSTSGVPSDPNLISYSNQEFRGAFFVTAVVGGKESRLSDVVDANSYAGIIPQSCEKSSILSYKDMSELPNVTAVRMMDYNEIKNFPIIWDYNNVQKIPSKSLNRQYIYKIRGKVLGTAFSIDAYLDGEPNSQDKDDLADRQDKINENNGVSETNDKISDAPPPVKTPTNPSTPSKPSDVSSQIPKTPAPSLDIEGTIANGLMNMQTRISLSAYPKVGDSTYLKDVLYKVLAQTPLALYEYSFGYDYSTSTLVIEYMPGTTKETVQKKQTEIKDKVKQVVSQVIKSGMSDYDKEKALHDWLCSNTEYDFEALKIAEKNGFKGMPAGHEDSFNPYGVLINGVGVCQSYAEAYKLLCEEAKLTCIVIRGELDGVPHAWNMVKLGTMYYHVDATNNDNEIPYPVFNSSDKDIELDYTISDTFALDNELPNFRSTNSKYDYYVLNSLSVSSTSDIKNMIEGAIKNGTETFNFKLVDCSLSPSELRDVFQNILNNSPDPNLKGMSVGRFASVMFGKFKK